MKKLIVSFLFLLLAGIMSLQAQQTISGTVTSSEDGSAVPGASIVVKGTTIGTITSYDGKYSISVPEDATALIVSFIGMKTLEVPIAGKTTINIVLEADVLGLEEVVVVAMGMQKSAKSLGYAVSQVDAGNTQLKSEPDVLKSLQGKVPGVDVRVSQGSPGAATRINIRGNSSFYGANQPLIIVDGVPYSNDQVSTSNQSYESGGAYESALSTLDPNDIANVSVLKGAAAAALYGSRAANGVVIIETKSGSTKVGTEKGLNVMFTSSLSWEQISNLPEYQNTYGNGANWIYSNANGSWGPKFDSMDSILIWNPDYKTIWPELFPGDSVPYVAQPDNVKSLFKTGIIKENSISFAGGNDKTSFSSTLSLMNHDGYIPNSSYDRASISVGGSSELSNGLNVRGNLSYSKTKQIGSFYGENQFDGASSSFARALFLGRTWDMSLPYENPATGGPVSTNNSQYDHPKWAWEHNTNTTVTDRVVTNFGVDYKLLKWLIIDYKIGTNLYSLNRKEVTDIGSRAAAGVGQIIEDNYRNEELYSNLMLKLAKSITDDISVKATLGQDINQRTTNRQAYKGKTMISKGIYDIDNTQDVVAYKSDVDFYGYSQRRLWGLYGDISLGYKDYLFLNITGRNDWSSTLPVDKRSYFYPAIASSFVFSEAFNLPAEILSYGQIRASYAKVGNDADPYSLYSIYELTDPFRDVPTITVPDYFNNPKLEPEFTSEIELGTNLSFVNNRANIDFAWYTKTSTNMIAAISIPAASGYSNLITNFGEINNKGVEIGLNLIPVKLSNSLKWSIYGTFTKNENLIVELGEGVDRIEVVDLSLENMNPVIEPGFAYGVFRGTVPLKDDDGNYLINPATGFIHLSDNDTIIGDPNPDFKLGITNSISFKGLTLSVLFDYTHGGDIYSVTINSLLGRGVSKDTEDRDHTWIIPGYYSDAEGNYIVDANGKPIENITQISTNDLYFYPGGPESTFGINSAGYFSVFDGTVYRLREVELAWQLPAKWFDKIFIGSATLSLTGRNLWYFAPNFPEYTNFDPDMNGFGSTNVQGVDLSCAPSAKRYGVNLKVLF